MSAIEVSVVSVFTDEHGAHGNPLGIVSNRIATEGREQELATLLGFSETVFLESVEDGVARLRIFTPATELPFAGHPTVGTAWWLGWRGEPVHTLEVPAGTVPVRTHGHRTFVTGRPEWAPEFSWHPYGTLGEIDELDPTWFDTGSHYAYAWIDEDAGRLRSRMFSPAMGIAEDEATGAAAVTVTALLGRGLQIEQGRGSQISTKLLPDGAVELGGRTVVHESRVITLP
jgi:predicted PhzF superfamily epimerase YddE/YHI9